MPDHAAFPDTRIAWRLSPVSLTAGGAFLFSWGWRRSEGRDGLGIRWNRSTMIEPPTEARDELSNRLDLLEPGMSLRAVEFGGDQVGDG